MKVLLDPSWELSTEHAASSGGQPLLVHRETGESYGSGDLVPTDAPSGFMTAADIVLHVLLQHDPALMNLDTDDHVLLDRLRRFV